jgi:glycolate oxidase subunit GlcD
MTLSAAEKSSLLKSFPPGQAFTSQVDLLAYELDAGVFPGTPEAVVFLTSAEEARRLLDWAAANHKPVVGRGAGTGLTGGAVADQGGVIASFSRMKAIIDIDEDQRLAVVEPGVANQEFAQVLLRSGLVYPPDPASYSVSTLGGNIAENAGGPHCLKYGVTGNYVQGLEAVLADSRALWFGGRAVDPPEFDFVSLLTGSEGTLALITQAVLRLRRPVAVGVSSQNVKTLTASFDQVAVAGQAVSAVIAAGLAPAAIELMDRHMINIVEDFLALGLPRQAAALLIFDIEGYPESLDRQLDSVAEVLGRFAPLEIKLARTAKERERLWLGRRSAAGARSRISPSDYTLDVSVPRSRLAEALEAITAISDRYQFPVTYLAHAGDGNLHPSLLCNLALEDHRQRIRLAEGEILRYCAGIGGSIGGEHGIGIEKRDYMSAMYSASEIGAMLQVKALFDPGNLLNPGKIFPANLPLTSEGLSAPLAAEPAPAFVRGETLEPQGVNEAADLLRLLQADKQVALLAGRGRQWRGATSDGVRVSTRHLDRVMQIAGEDLYVTVQAGASIKSVQDALNEKGFWLALASPWPEGSLGGLLATNLNSPLRTLYGGLRDQLLAVQVALADGRLLRFGRPLVKDVAGYQMNKLFCGSFGALGLLTEITLKIFPRPLARRTLAAAASTCAQALKMGYAVLREASTSSGILLLPGSLVDGRADGFSLVVTLEGYPLDVSAEMAEIYKALEAAGGAGQEVEGTSAAQLWAERLASWPVLVRAGYCRANQAGPVAEVAAARAGDWALDLANGLLMASGNGGDPDQAAGVLKALRQAAGPESYAILAAGPRLWLKQFDAWGAPPPAHSLMRSLKLAWDPADILNRGEFI